MDPPLSDLLFATYQRRLDQLGAPCKKSPFRSGGNWTVMQALPCPSSKIRFEIESGLRKIKTSRIHFACKVASSKSPDQPRLSSWALFAETPVPWNVTPPRQGPCIYRETQSTTYTAERMTPAILRDGEEESAQSLCNLDSRCLGLHCSFSSLRAWSLRAADRAADGAAHSRDQ